MHLLANVRDHRMAGCGTTDAASKHSGVTRVAIRCSALLNEAAGAAGDGLGAGSEGGMGGGFEVQ